MIPWGTSFADITNYGDPTIKQMEESRHFKWPGVSFLGLSGDAGACLMQRGPDNPCAHRDAYHLFLPDFHLVLFDVAQTPNTDPESRLRAAFSHMKSHFGPATFCYPKYTKSLPSFFWELGHIFVSCSLQYGGEHVAVSVRHSTPEHQRELAAFDEPHPGARSDFVKWNDLW